MLDWIVLSFFLVAVTWTVITGTFLSLSTAILLGVILAVRILIKIGRRLLWKIRSRLIVSSIFFTVTPLFLISVLFYLVATFLVFHYNSLIFENLMQRNLDMYELRVDRFLQNNDIPEMIQEARQMMSRGRFHRLNGVFFQFRDGSWQPVYSFPSRMRMNRIDFSQLAKIFQSGFFRLNSHLYQGVLKLKEDRAVLLFEKMEQSFFDSLPRLGDFHIMFQPPPQSGEQSIIQTSQELSRRLQSREFAGFDRNRLSFPYHYRYWDFDEWKQDRPSEKEFWVVMIINYARVYERLRGIDPTKSIAREMTALKKELETLAPGEEKRQKEQRYLDLEQEFTFLQRTRFASSTEVFGMLVKLIILLFGLFILLSIWIGFRIIRVITQSVDQMTRGMERIRRGDFSYRIHIHSHDQMHFLAESFNEMTSGIDRLLKEEKERQRLEEELRIARSIQLRLLPKDYLDTDEFEIAAVNIPAQEIAGDYFDYFYRPGKQLTVLVADVSGKGASAAFYMAELKGVMNYLETRDLSPREMIAESHKSLLPTFDKVTYITVNLVRVELKKRRLTLARAGHTPAILYDSRTRECREILPTGPAIGLNNFEEKSIEEFSQTYRKGDLLFFFSDGLSEMMNPEGESLGLERLMEVLRRYADAPADEIRQRILDCAIDFSQSKNSHDDLTFVVIKMK